MAGVAPRDDRGPIAPSGPDRAPIAPSGPDQAPIAPSGPDRAPIAPSGPDPGKIALSLVALLYKAASSATPAVRMVPGRFWEGVVLLGISPELIWLRKQMRMVRGYIGCFESSIFVWCLYQFLRPLVSDFYEV